MTDTTAPFYGARSSDRRRAARGDSRRFVRGTVIGLGALAAGAALVTLSGPVAYPGVYEIEHGASLTSLIDAAGGTTAAARAALLGGYAGAWIDGSLLGGLSLSDEHLATHGASLGAGVVLLLSQDACPVAETASVARWLADQCARQCGPCGHRARA